jgi:hypothetical protein
MTSDSPFFANWVEKTSSNPQGALYHIFVNETAKKIEDRRMAEGSLAEVCWGGILKAGAHT